jgi:hypothetical protein
MSALPICAILLRAVSRAPGQDFGRIPIAETLQSALRPGLRPTGGPILTHSDFECGGNPARKPKLPPGNTIA